MKTEYIKNTLRGRWMPGLLAFAMLMANEYGRGAQGQDARPVIEGGRNVTHSLLANWNSGTILPDVLRDNSLLLASQALDDFRRLGEHDLAINHGITRTNRVVRESSNVTSP